MDAKTFADAYKPIGIYTYRDPHPVRGEILNDAAEWSDKFSGTFMDWLDGITLDPIEADKFIHEYELWHQYSLTRKLSNQNMLDDQPSSEVVQRFISEIEFHNLNGLMANIWRFVLAGLPVPKHVLQNIRNNLASASVFEMDDLRRHHPDNSLYKWTGGSTGHYKLKVSIDKAYLGSVTEKDFCVALLDAVEDNSKLAVLPAPSQFEHSKSSSMNSDVLLVDIDTREVTGFQLKTNRRLGWLEAKEYDENFVTVVDGVDDLKNYVFLRKPNDYKEVPVPMPGIYSAHHLLAQKQIFRQGRKSKAGALQYSRAHMLMKAKMKAHDLVYGLESVNGQVREHLAATALRSLYRQDSELPI